MLLQLNSYPCMCQYISFAFTFGAVEMWSVVIGVERTFTMIYAAFFFCQICWVALARGRTIRPQLLELQGAPAWTSRVSRLISIRKIKRTGPAVAVRAELRPARMIREISEVMVLEIEARMLVVEDLEVVLALWVKGRSIDSPVTSPIDQKRHWNSKKITISNRPTLRYC